MRKVFLAALGALLLSVVFVESASAQRWGYRGAGWGGRAIGGFYGRPGGFYGRPFVRPGLGLYRPGWRAAGLYGWRRPYLGYGYGWRRPGLGWGAAGIVAGVAAASYYGYSGYGYAAYGYPSYGYSAYAYPSNGCGCGYASSYSGGYGWRY
jgi:hypothetical protein